MKLNNRGWGIKEMLVLSAILIFFFGLAIYFIYMLYSSLAKDLKSDSNYIDVLQYEAIEDKLKESGEKFIEDNINKYTAGDIVLINELVKADYSNFIYDPNTGNLCEAYISVLDVDSLEVKAFIKCDEYETLGYEE